MTVRSRPLAVVVLLAAGASLHVTLAGGAPKQTPTAAPAAGPAERALARRASALLDVAPGALGLTVGLTGPRDGIRATLDHARKRVTLHVGPGPAHRVAHDLAHEFGHAVDLDQLDPAARRRWLMVRGVPAQTPWWPDSRSDYATGAGDFAEVFAACHAASPEFRSRVAPAPADPCALVARFDRGSNP